MKVLRNTVILATATSLVMLVTLNARADLQQVVHWAFDGNTNDSSGFQNNGSLGGGDTSYESGKWGQAISLTEGAYVHNNAATDLPLNATDSWSMNLWLSLSSQPESLSDLAQFGIRQNSDYVGQSRGFLQYGSGGQGFYFWGNSADLSSDTTYTADDQWHMYTITYAGNTQEMRMYRDGGLMKLQTVALATASGIADSTGTKLRDPREVDVGGPSPWRPNSGGWAGKVDEFTIWRGELTQNQIANLTTTNAIPEPSALLLLCCGLCGMLAYAWRRQK